MRKHHSLLAREIPRGVSLMEVIAAVAISAAAAITIVPRLTHPADKTKQSACELHQARLNLEINLYQYATGQWPDNLSQVTDDLQRFPEGAPVCPVANVPYQLDATGQQVVSHHHD